MEKIDRLGWASGICFEAYGLKIGVRCNRQELPEDVLDCLPPGWKPIKPPFVDVLWSLRLGRNGGPESRTRQFHLLYMGLTRVSRTMNAGDVWSALESTLHHYVAEHSTTKVFVHAGVVAFGGRALLLPGRSFSGKSTLVAELLKAGATYYSDEYALLDEAGRVAPFARRLGLREDGQIFPSVRLQPEELGSRAGTEPLPVELIAMSRFQPGRRWQPRELSPGRSVLEMLNNTVPARNQPERCLRALQAAARRARSFKGMRGEATEAAHALLQEIAA